MDIEPNPAILEQLKDFTAQLEAANVQAALFIKLINRVKDLPWWAKIILLCK